MEMKYITYQSEDGLGERFVIFDKITNHSDIAKGLPSFEMLGAGFMYLDEEGWATCFGESVSMGIESRGDMDDDIISQLVRR